jgi:hypothetical protein
MGVTLCKNYGSGFTFPLFLFGKKKPNKKELHYNPSRKTTAIEQN